MQLSVRHIIGKFRTPVYTRTWGEEEHTLTCESFSKRRTGPVFPVCQSNSEYDERGVPCGILIMMLYQEAYLMELWVHLISSEFSLVYSMLRYNTCSTIQYTILSQ